VDREVHVHAFIDMHDLGDALLRAGLSDVVMDTERFAGRYQDLRALTTELKQLGVNNAAQGRPKGLTPASRWFSAMPGARRKCQSTFRPPPWHGHGDGKAFAPGAVVEIDFHGVCKRFFYVPISPMGQVASP